MIHLANPQSWPAVMVAWFWSFGTDGHSVWILWSLRPASRINILIETVCLYKSNRYEDNKDIPEEVCFVDLQMPMLSRPTYDLAQLLCSSATPKVRNTHLDSLLRYYHEELTSFLKKHGYKSQDLYSIDDLLMDFQHSFPAALFFSLVNVQVWNISHIEGFSLCRSLYRIRARRIYI